MNQPFAQSQKSKLLGSILQGGALVGVLDGCAAIVSAYLNNGTSPVRVFQYIASGIFGKEAFTQGYASATAGLLLHFIIATGWTMLFYLAYRKARIGSVNKIVAGMAYGMVVLLAMKFIIVPLSNVPRAGAGTLTLTQVLIHIFLVGLPISLHANRFFLNNKAGGLQ